MFKQFLGLAFVVLFLEAPRLAVAADQACPTTPDANNAILHVYGMPTFPAGHKVQYTIGQFDFYGARPIGACVWDDTAHSTPTMYAVVDSNNSLLPGLPKAFNHLCLTNAPDRLTVASANGNECGVTMYPLNYSGSELMVYGRGGNDAMSGGNGTTALWGGAGNDSLMSHLDQGTFYSSALIGESGDDVLFGSRGRSYLEGGDGIDGLQDPGGSDILVGNAGNDCCIVSSEQFKTGGSVSIDCGSGTDVVQSLAQTVNCETTRACSLFSCPGFPF